MKRYSVFAIVLIAFTVVLSVAAQDSYTVKTRTARVRAEPNTTSRVVGTLRFGAELDIIEAVEGARVSGSTVWYHIQLTNNDGYIHSSLVQAPSSGGIVPSGNNAGGGNSSNNSAQPTPEAISTPAPDAPPIAPPQTGVTCNGKTTCGQMDSCEQAYACLAAGRASLDRDKDGVPCESICPGG